MTELARETDQDFRARAVKASQAALQSRPQSVQSSPAKAGISYCLPSKGSSQEIRRKIKLIAVLSTLAAPCAWAIGYWLVKSAHHHFFPSDALGAVVITTCWLGGFLLFLVPSIAEKYLITRFIRENDRQFWSELNFRQAHVSIENAATYGRFKFLAEDIGLVLVYPDRVEIEGVSFRYMILRKDVVELYPHRNNRTVIVTYKIADETLSIAITSRSIFAELKRQLAHARPAMIAWIGESLEGKPK